MITGKLITYCLGLSIVATCLQVTAICEIPEISPAHLAPQQFIFAPLLKQWQIPPSNKQQQLPPAVPPKGRGPVPNPLDGIAEGN